MTEQVNLGGAWRMREADSETWHSAHVPGSVYADLMADGTMLTRSGVKMSWMPSSA